MRTRAEWLRIAGELYEIAEFAFDEVEVLDFGVVGVVRSRYRQAGSMGGEDRTQSFLMTDVWVERNGGPQLVTRYISPLG